MIKFKEFKTKLDEGIIVKGDDNNFDELDDGSQDVTLEELHDLIDYIDEIDYDTIADLLLDFIDTHYEEEIEDEGDEYEDDVEFEGELDEKIATRFTGKKKGIRKFTKSKAKMRRERVKRKSILRKKRVKNRIARKKNKIKIKKYQASRNKAIKAGQHQAKIHRGK